MPDATVTMATVFEDGGASLMARVVGPDAANITQAGTTSITWAAYDVVAGGAATASDTLTVSSVVFDTLQTDARWTVDSTGYNFRHDMPATTFATGGTTYRIEYKFTPASGEVYWVVFEVNCLPILTS